MTNTENNHRTAGEQLAKDFSQYVNSMSSAAHDVAFAEEIASDHRTLQQKATATMLTAICVMARQADGGWVDGRNEQSAAICQKIRDLLVAEDVFFDKWGAVRFAFV